MQQGRLSEKIAERLKIIEEITAELQSIPMHPTRNYLGTRQIELLLLIMALPNNFIKVMAAIRQLDLSARAYHCILKPDRMISDLAGSEDSYPIHAFSRGVARFV